MATPNVASVLSYAQVRAGTDTNGIDSTNTTGNGMLFINDGLQDMTRELIKRNIDAAQTQESSASGTTGTYAWPSDMWMLKTIEVNYTDTQQGNYIQAQKMDVSNLQFQTSFDFVRLNQPTTAPLFTNHGDTFEIFPTPTGTVNIKIFYYLTPTEYTAFSTALVYPQTLDYRILGEYVIAKYYESVEKMDKAKIAQDRYMQRLDEVIKILAPQSQQPTVPDKLHLTGWEF